MQIYPEQAAEPASEDDAIKTGVAAVVWTWFFIFLAISPALIIAAWRAAL